MDKIVNLTDGEKDLVFEADDRFGSYSHGSTATRFYTVARNRKDGDIAFVLCAVFNERGKAKLEVAGITSVMASHSYFSERYDIIHTWSIMSPHRIVFNKGEKRGMWKLDAKTDPVYWAWSRPLNISDVVANNPRFRYCALPKWGDNALAWLRLYKDYPEAEYFSKLDITRLARPKFIEKLRNNKDLLKYLVSNRDEIVANYLAPRFIEYGYRHGISPSGVAAKRDFDAKRKRTKGAFKYDYIEFPKKFDWGKLAEYMDKENISHYEYSRYIQYCINGGADILDPNTAFPHNLERRLKEFDEAKHKMEIAECNRKLKARAKKLASKLTGMRMGDFTVVIPSTADMLVKEGKRMDNCIGGGNYATRMAANECVCVFIRKKDKPNTPFVDCEIVDGKVRQCYGRKNKKADDKTKKFANRLASAFFGKKRSRAA